MISISLTPNNIDRPCKNGIGKHLSSRGWPFSGVIKIGYLQQNWSFPLVHSPRYLRAVADVSAQTSLGLEPSAILWKQQRLSCRVPWVLFVVRSCVTLWFPVDPFHPFWQLLAIDLCWIAPVSATLQNVYIFF
jgi:hypothetical protein